MFICITIPSSLLFFSLSKYKDARFFVTFCFLDTVCLVITFFARAAELALGTIAGIIAYITIAAVMCCAYFKGKPYFKRYRELMSNVHDGWVPMAISTLLIYVLLIFTSTYPEPLINRTQYLLPHALLSLTVISFYAVFILSLLQKQRLYDLNITLQQEQKWHNIAYIDVLTNMKNRMAYIEKINELEREDTANLPMHALMLDLDNFKSINDTFGHHVGDETLKKASQYLKNLFNEDNYTLFRIGGDEFAIIAVDVETLTVKGKIQSIIDDNYNNGVGCTFSVGYSQINKSQNNSIENAFIRADNDMYEMKAKKKALVH